MTVLDKIKIKGLVVVVAYLGAPLQTPQQRLLILAKPWLHSQPSPLPRVNNNFVTSLENTW